MKNFIKYSSVTILLGIGLNSCEKIIQLELNEADKVYVIDGMVSNYPQYNYVKLSKTASFYETQNFEEISGANITITDGDGNEYILTESQPGYYTNSSLVGTPYTTYSLNIDVNGENIKGTTNLPGGANIDSIVVLQNQGGFFGDGYSSFVYWFDKAAEKNYYRVRGFRNFEKEDLLLVTEDNLYNGIGTGTPLFGINYELNDTVLIELMEIDKPTYKYWYTLNQNVGGQSSAPGNPETNLTNGAVGYFGGYYVSSDTLVVTE